MTTERLLTVLRTTLDGGLTSQEVLRRIGIEGKNVVQPPPRMPLPLRFLMTLFVSGFSPLLWIAAGLAFAIYPPPLSNPANLPNLYLAIALILVIMLSGILAFWQEFQADKTLGMS